MNKSELKQEINEINCDLVRGKSEIIKQNKKIQELNENLANTEEKSKITKSYLSGFTGFFGFFPNIFSGIFGKKDKKTKNKVKKDTDQGMKIIHNKNEENPMSQDDDLESEIFELRKNALEIRQEITTSQKGSEELDKRIDKTSKKIQSISKEADKVLKSY